MTPLEKLLSLKPAPRITVVAFYANGGERVLCEQASVKDALDAQRGAMRYDPHATFEWRGKNLPKLSSLACMGEFSIN
jgi:hypothetical protein